MKSKLFSMLMLLVAVFLFGNIQAQVPSDTDPQIEIVEDFERISAEVASVADAEVESDIQLIIDNTSQQAGSFLPNYSGDIDHQLFCLQATSHNAVNYSRYRLYMPRSNLHYYA